MVAPAVNLTLAAHSTTDDPPSGWTLVEGTSYATPHVSGVVALMLQAAPEIAELNGVDVLETIRGMLRETAEARGDPYDPDLSDKYSVRYGFGILDGYEAVRRATEFRTGNKAPVIDDLIAEPDVVEPGGTSSIRVEAQDPDGDGLEYSAEATGGELTGTGPTWTWTAPEDEGEYGIEVTVSDPFGNIVTSSLTVTVLGSGETNLPPEISSFRSSSEVMEVESRIELYVEAEDPDGDTLVYYYSASDGMIAGSGHRVRFEAPDDPGEVIITVTVEDGRGGIDSERLTVRVIPLPPHEPPVIVLATATPDEIDEGNRSSWIDIIVVVEERTSPIQGVYADLSELGQRSSRLMIYDTTLGDGGRRTLQYSLGLDRLHSLEEGNYTIIITAEDDANYISEPVEIPIRVLPSNGEQPVILSEDRDDGFPFWVLIPILIFVGIIIALTVLFILTRRSKRSGAMIPQGPATYQAVEIT